MKKLITICLLMAASFVVKSQQITSGDYTITISDISKSKESGEMMGIKYEHHITKGIYEIRKKRKKIVSQKFTFLESPKATYKNVSVLNIRADDYSGNSINYDHNTNTFEFAGDEYKGSKSDKTIQIILRGILFYTLWLDKQ